MHEWDTIALFSFAQAQAQGYAYAPRPYGVGAQDRLGSLNYPLQIKERVSYSHWQQSYGLNRYDHMDF